MVDLHTISCQNKRLVEKQPLKRLCRESLPSPPRRLSDAVKNDLVLFRDIPDVSLNDVGVKLSLKLSNLTPFLPQRRGRQPSNSQTPSTRQQRDIINAAHWHVINETTKKKKKKRKCSCPSAMTWFHSTTRRASLTQRMRLLRRHRLPRRHNHLPSTKDHTLKSCFDFWILSRTLERASPNTAQTKETAGMIQRARASAV